MAAARAAENALDIEEDQVCIDFYDIANINLMNAPKILPTKLLVVSSFYNPMINFYTQVIFN